MSKSLETQNPLNDRVNQIASDEVDHVNASRRRFMKQLAIVTTASALSGCTSTFIPGQSIRDDAVDFYGMIERVSTKEDAEAIFADAKRRIDNRIFGSSTDNVLVEALNSADKIFEATNKVVRASDARKEMEMAGLVDNSAERNALEDSMGEAQLTLDIYNSLPKKIKALMLKMGDGKTLKDMFASCRLTYDGKPSSMTIGLKEGFLRGGLSLLFNYDHGADIWTYAKLFVNEGGFINKWNERSLSAGVSLRKVEDDVYSELIYESEMTQNKQSVKYTSWRDKPRLGRKPHKEMLRTHYYLAGCSDSDWPGILTGEHMDTAHPEIRRG